MRRIPSCLLLSVAVLIFAGGGPRRAHANGWFFFDPITLELEFRYDGNFDTYERLEGNDEQYRNSLAEARVAAEQRFYLVDPRIAEFNLRLAPVYRRGRETRLDESDSYSGEDLNYGFFFDLLRGAEFPASAYFNTSRTTDSNDLAFGGRTEFEIEDTTLGLSWHNDWLPMNVEYREKSGRNEQLRATGGSFLRDEDRQGYVAKASNRRLHLRAERTEVNNNVNSTQYVLGNYDAQHNLRWGRGSSVASNIRLNDRSGYLPSQRFQWSEQLNLHHTDTVESHSVYRFIDVTAGDTTRTHQGEMELRHSLYRNLDSAARLLAEQRESSVEQRLDYSVGGRTAYRKSFSFGDVGLQLNGEYGRVDRDSLAGLAEAIDERHVARLAEPIVLRNQFVEQDTIVVLALDGFTYARGLDYEVSTLGGVYAQIRVIPTGRIADGETLSINYWYRVLPSAEYQVGGVGYSFSYAYRWGRLYHSAQKNGYSLISGSVLPAEYASRATGLELNWDLTFATARLTVENRDVENGGLDSRTLTLGETLGITLSPRLNFSIGSSQVYNRSSGLVYEDPLQNPEGLENSVEFDYLTLDAGLNWNPRPNLAVMPGFSLWKRDETQVRNGDEFRFDDLYYSARLRVGWWYRLVSVELLLDHNGADESGLSRDRNRIYLSLHRQFR